MGTILEVRDVKKYYPVKRGLLYKTKGWIKAVDGVSFCLERGRTLALVGESGCGKTTLARLIARLIEADSGQVNFIGQDIAQLPAAEMRQMRRNLQIIFQDPFNSLDPRFTVSRIISEGLLALSKPKGKREAWESLQKIISQVGLPESSLLRYPHEFSGGQRQRISIARSLILNPQLLILDEPVSSLDVSIQAQIINLLLELQEQFKLTYLFIAHDLNLVKSVSDEVCVMYLGKIVEQAAVGELFSNTLHPYTKLLLSSSPQLDSPRAKRPSSSSQITQQPQVKGCPFYPRCLQRKDICKDSQPQLCEVKPGHLVSCHL